MIRGSKGFTLIELVLVIIILGILAVVAVPRFINLRSQAMEAARDGVVGGVRAGISHAHAAYLTNRGADLPSPLNNLSNTTVWNTTSGYPIALDGAADNSNGDSTNTMFSYILESGITDSRWHKTNNSTYYYNDDVAANNFSYNAGNGSYY